MPKSELNSLKTTIDILTSQIDSLMKNRIIAENEDLRKTVGGLAFNYATFLDIDFLPELKRLYPSISEDQRARTYLPGCGNSMTEPRPIPNHEYSVELRFTGENLVPSEITARLGLRPTNFFARGMDCPDAKNRLPFWGYDAQSDRENYRGWEFLEEGFEFVCRELRSKKAEIIKLSHEFEGLWWCGHFQSSFDGGPTFTPSFLAEIASYELPLVLDNHFISDTPECDQS